MSDISRVLFKAYDGNTKPTKIGMRVLYSAGEASAVFALEVAINALSLELEGMKQSEKTNYNLTENVHV